MPVIFSHNKIPFSQFCCCLLLPSSRLEGIRRQWSQAEKYYLSVDSMVLKRKLQTEQNCLLCWSTYLGSTGKRERGFAVGDLDKLGRSLLKTSPFVSSVRVVWSWELAKVDSGNWESWSGSWDVDKSLCFGGLRCLCRASANISTMIGAWKRLLNIISWCQ